MCCIDVNLLYNGRVKIRQYKIITRMASLSQWLVFRLVHGLPHKGPAKHGPFGAVKSLPAAGYRDGRGTPSQGSYEIKASPGACVVRLLESERSTSDCGLFLTWD